MKIQEAIALIELGIPLEDKPQHWADLGCGNGTSTYALAHPVSPGSSIIAVDRLPQKLNRTAGNNVSIQFQLADMSLESLTLPKLDGILMANSLHYIQEKERLVKYAL